MKQQLFSKHFIIFLLSLSIFGLHSCTTYTSINNSIVFIYPTTQVQNLDTEFSPYIWASDFVTYICSQLLTTTNILTSPPYSPHIQNLHFILHASKVTKFFSLANMQSLVESSYFDVRKKVVIFVTGWLQHPKDSTYVNDMAAAYQYRGDYNFLVLDDADYLNTVVYTWAAVNTDIIGQHIASAITVLTTFIPVDNVHLIGHSLGAQVVGAAGRYFRSYTGKFLPHITGLDPAKPCFTMGGLNELFRGNAKFIDIIHTNPGVLGIRQPVGDVDFYVDSLSPLLSDCSGPLCAHLRSITFYTDTVYPQHEKAYLARCFPSGNCSSDVLPMGFAVPKNATGNYLVSNKAFNKL